MKYKILLTVLIAVISTQLLAQKMNISTNLREDCVYDSVANQWDVLSSNDDELTFFEFNKDFTMFKHTTPSITSAYMIKTNKEDKEKNQFQLEIVSDVGNAYIMVIDLNEQNMKFFYERGESLYMVKHTIKKVWFDEN